MTHNGEGPKEPRVAETCMVTEEVELGPDGKLVRVLYKFGFPYHEIRSDDAPPAEVEA